MEQITILGAGIAGLAFASELKQRSVSAKVRLIDKKSRHFDLKEFFDSFALKGQRNLEEWAAAKGMEFIQATAERVSIARKKIYFKERGALEFDKLAVAAGLISKDLSIKGQHRDGFFYLSDIDAVAARNLLKLSSDITVFVSTILGLRLAVNLRALGKDVSIISSSLDFLGDRKDSIIEFLRSQKIALYLNSDLQEAIGEGLIKAVKISPLKVFVSQMVFADSGFLPNSGFFEEQVYQRNSILTNFDDVYFIGDVTRKGIGDRVLLDLNYERSQAQAHILADYILEGQAPCFQEAQITLERKQKLLEDISAIKGQELTQSY